MGKQFLKNILLFLAIFLALNLVFRGFGGKDDANETSLKTGDLGVMTTETTYPLGKTVSMTLRNNKKEAITFPSECPSSPFSVLSYDEASSKFQPIAASYESIDCRSIPSEITLEPEKEITISYDLWNHGLFGKIGRYKIMVNEVASNEFIVEKASFFRSLWQTALFQPIYNILIFFARILPSHSLGMAIILLTLLIRLLLFIPAQRAMRSQRRMQELQPLLDKIKQKYEGNKQRISEETMKIWKEHKVNPLGGCLPLIIQLPILIALFYVIQGGIQADDQYLLYEFLKSFPLMDIDAHFLNILDLTKVNRYILPLLVGGLQFLQMKLAMKSKKPASDGEPQKEMAAALHTTQSMMTYFLPVMIALFTASVPAGVGLYWGISTLFGIGQQLLVNKEKTG